MFPRIIFWNIFHLYHMEMLFCKRFKIFHKFV
jgi:hypothetical protein